MNSALALDLCTGHHRRRETTQTAPEASDEAPARDIHRCPKASGCSTTRSSAPSAKNEKGIVYLAWDHVLEQHVAVREYLPGALASRDPVSAAVVAKSKGRVTAFQVGLCSFINQARMLGRSITPRCPGCCISGKATARHSMAMPYYEGARRWRACWWNSAGRRTRPSCALAASPARCARQRCTCRSACTAGSRAPILLTDDGPVLTAFGGIRDVGDDLDAPLSDLRALAGWCTRPLPASPRRAGTIGSGRSPKWRGVATAAISWMRSTRRCRRYPRAVARARLNSGTGSAAPTIAGTRTSTC